MIDSQIKRAASLIAAELHIQNELFILGDEKRKQPADGNILSPQNLEKTAGVFLAYIETGQFFPTELFGVSTNPNEPFVPDNSSLMDNINKSVRKPKDKKPFPTVEMVPTKGL